MTIIWYSSSKGFRAQMVRLFLVFTYIWQEDVAKIFKVSRAPHNINLGRAITWVVGITIYCTVLNNNLPPPRQFLRVKILLKKISEGKCSSNKLLNLNSGGLYLLLVYVLVQLVIFMIKQKSLRKIFE